MKTFLILTSAATLLAAPHWTPQTSGVMATFRGASAASDTMAFVSGSGTNVLRTTDGGATWTKLTLSADRLDFRDVDAIDTKIVYALSIGNGPASRIFKSLDGGDTWAEQFRASDPKMFLDAMSFWDADHGIVFGDSVDGQFTILTTKDGGKTWDRVEPKLLPPALENEGAFAGSGTNIAVLGTSEAWIGTGAAAKSRVLHTTDAGKTWTVADTPIQSGPSSGIFSIAFRDRMNGVVVGGDYRKESEAVDNLAITRDGGKTWMLAKGQTPSASYLSGFRSVVRYVPGTSSLIAVGPQGSDWSDDDGRSWIPIAGPGYHTFSFSPTGKVGWGAGNRGSVGRLER